MISLDPNEPRYAIFPVFLAALALVLAAPVFWLLTEVRYAEVAESFQNADLYQFYYPAYQYAFGRLAAGELPLWNPAQLCGTPMLADPRLGIFQPIHAIFLALPIERAMAVHAYLCLALMGAGFVLYARALGVGYWAALLGALAFTFCGATAGAMSRPDAAATLAWAPFTAWGMAMYLQRFHPGAAVLTGIGGALMLLGGVYPLVLLFALLAAPIAAWCVLHPPDTNAPGLFVRWGGLVMAAVIALAVSAVQWVPAVLWARDHPGAWEAILRVPLAVQNPLSTPDLFTQFLRVTPGPLPRLAYIGIGGLLLLPAALFHRPAWRAVALFAVSAPVLLLIAYAGELRLPPYLPPEAFALAAMFALASLAAFGADRLLLPRSVAHPPSAWPPVIAVGITALALFVVAPASTRGTILIFVVAAAPFLVFRHRWLLPVTGLVLVGVTFIDLAGASNNTYTHPFMDAPARYQTHPGALATAQEQATGGRVLVSARLTDTGLPANIGMLAALRSAGAYDMPPSAAGEAWWRRLTGESPARTGADALTPGAPHPELLDFMAVRAVIAAKGAGFDGGFQAERTPALRPLREEADLRLAVNESALPRAYWTPQWVTAHGPEAALDALLDPAFDRDRTAVVDRAAPDFPDAFPEPTDTGDATRTDAPCLVDDVSPERVQVRVTTPAEGILVLADSHDRGWAAAVNGTPAPLLRVNGMFRGVLLEAGEHTIDFTYQPVGIAYGSAVSLIGLGLLVLWGGIALIKTLRTEA